MVQQQNCHNKTDDVVIYIYDIIYMILGILLFSIYVHKVSVLDICV